MRRTVPKPLGPALDRVADRLMPATLLAAVERAWPEAVGEAIAEVSRPVAERGGVVTVACSAAVWAQEIDLMSELLVERLNEALPRPAVTGLRVQSRPPRNA